MQEPKRIENLSYHLSIIPDPRVDRCKEHSLHDVLMIAILGMLCGAESFVDFEDFGKAKEEWLRGFLALPNGIPSHDTFGRVFAAMNNQLFAESFQAWTEGLRSFGMVESLREIDGVINQETRFFLASISANTKNFARAVRGHWAVENSLHWSLDVCFAEDACRIRVGYAAENMAVLRHIALNVLKNDSSLAR